MSVPEDEERELEERELDKRGLLEASVDKSPEEAMFMLL